MLFEAWFVFCFVLLVFVVGSLNCKILWWMAECEVLFYKIIIRSNLI